VRSLVVSSMTPAEKGERYARIFRKAGAFVGNGNIARAIATLKEGQQFAREQGDLKMADRFAKEIENLAS
jgi:hypothetical protein